MCDLPECFSRDEFSNCSFLRFFSMFKHQTLQRRTLGGVDSENMTFVRLEFTQFWLEWHLKFHSRDREKTNYTEQGPQWRNQNKNRSMQYIRTPDSRQIFDTLCRWWNCSEDFGSPSCLNTPWINFELLSPVWTNNFLSHSLVPF